MKFLSFLFLIFFPALALSQTNFSISANVGLVAAEENLGKAVMIRPAMELNRWILEAGYLYSELDSNNAGDSQLRIYKYSLAGGYLVYSDDKNFQATGKAGPSLMYFRGFNSDQPKIGFDLGLTLSYTMFWDMLDLEMGVTNSLNKETKIFVQTFFGLKYNLRKKNK